MKNLLFVALVLCAGCCPEIHQEADRARYDAMSNRIKQVDTAALAAAMATKDATQMANADADVAADKRFFTSWAADISAHEGK